MFRFTRSDDLGGQTVEFSVGGTAAWPDDHDLFLTSVQFSGSSLTADLTITAVDDTDVDPASPRWTCRSR